MTDTQKRIALVTGGSRGLGRSEAIALAHSGVDVIITSRSADGAAADVVAELETAGAEAHALQLDLGETDSFADFAARVRSLLSDVWQRDTLDILVNNAGSAFWTPLGSIDAADVRAAFDIHVVSTVMLTQTLEPLIADGGRVINTSSGLSRFVGESGYSVYAAAKGAVEVWTRYLANELAQRRITVNAIAPGATGTDFAGGMLRDDDAVRAGLAGAIAMGHVGEPDDVGAVVAAIASEQMGWVTAQRIEASGGMRL